MAENSAVDARIRERQAIALRLEGLTFERIAEELGYTNRPVAYNIVTRALHRETVQDVEEVRAEELARLDSFLEKLTPAIDEFDPPSGTSSPWVHAK